MKTYDRDIDYLGEIGRILRDLTGYSTLAYELIQNADDDRRATRLAFDVRDDALIVQHDGVFSDCGDQEVPPNQCPSYLATGDRCDLHSFRRVGGANKTQREETTGAFGIGFTAVYQVTDRPELATAGHHWYIDETAARSEGIQACELPDCDLCGKSAEGTTLRLPWASDAHSEFRRETRSQPVPEDVHSRLTDELLRAVPRALTFLRRLKAVEVRANGELRCLARRERRGDSLTIRVDGATEVTTEEFILLEGAFPTEASSLRERYEGLVEDSRSHTVQVAVPTSTAKEPGLYFAGLPTEDRTELPVHINGDFFPNSERKHLVREGFRGEWNDAALDCAAQTLSEALSLLPGRVDVSIIWNLLLAAYQLAQLDSVRGGDRYWVQLARTARTADVLLTADGRWVAPSTAYYLQDASEQENAFALAKLGLRVAGGEVAEVARRGLKATELGLKLLTSSHLGTELVAFGLEDEVEAEDLPGPLNDNECVNALLREVEILITREKLDVLHNSGLGKAAVLPCTDQTWRSVLSVLPKLPPELGFLESERVLPVIDSSALPSGTSTDLYKKCTPLDPDYLIRCLHDQVGERLAELMGDPHRCRPVLLWLSRHRNEISDAERRRLAELPVFPTAGGLAPIGNLRLPSADFEDELGLADVLILTGLEEARPLLAQLGAPPLDFKAYISLVVPQAVEDGVHEQDPARWVRLLDLLWRSSSRIIDDPEMVRSLVRCPVVPTTREGPPFVTPREAYFPSEEVSRCLGTKYPTASMPKHRREAATQLLARLGVANEPRPAHLLSVLEAIQPHPGDARARSLAQNILKWLGYQPGLRERPPQFGAFQPLATRAWLPAKEDRTRWYAPDELYTAFVRPLVGSVGPFLDLEFPQQQKIATALDVLGVRNDPETGAIVEHLANLARAGKPVSRAVYVRLNSRAGNENDALAISRLRATKCLLIEGGTYVAPSHVFSRENPFGRRRVVLGDSFPFAQLLKAMGVKDEPGHEDAIELLLEIATEYEARGNPLSEDDCGAVRAAWRILQRDLEDGHLAAADLEEALARRTCVLLEEGQLAAPSAVYLADSPVIARAIAPHPSFGLIDRDELIWRAHRAAGVLNLSEDAVPVEVELSGITPLPRLRDGWYELWPAIARVLAAVSDAPLDEARDRLLALDISRVDELAIQYRLRRHPGLVNPVQRPGSVLLERDPVPQLYVTDVDRARRDIARELARHLAPESNPVSFVAALSSVLGASSLEEAHELLDAFDVARLVESLPEVKPSSVLSDLAGEDDEPLADQGDETTDPYSDEQVDLEDERDGPADVGRDEGADAVDSEFVDEDAGHADSALTGPSEHAGSPAASSGATGFDPSLGRPGGTLGAASSSRVGEGASAGSRARPSGSRSSGQLRSYVSHEPRKDRDSDGNGRARSEVDEAGVAHVVRFEEAAGRTPDVKPHHNKGFDIVSRETETGEELVIEVKSLTGEWGARGAAMSPAQFSHAKEHGDRYWLYVVEFATDHERARLWRIQNPANRVQQFFFDDGWEAVALRDELQAAPAIELPELHDETGHGRIPVFDLRDGLDVAAGYLSTDESVIVDDQIVVQVRGRTLADRYPPGTLVLVEASDEVPEEGEVVLLELPLDDPDTGLRFTVRTWWEEDGVVTLGGGNGVAPLSVPDRPRVIGRVVREISKTALSS